MLFTLLNLTNDISDGGSTQWRELSKLERDVKKRDEKYFGEQTVAPSIFIYKNRRVFKNIKKS